MRTIHNILGFVLATAVLVSCVRKNDTVEPYTAPQGGKGGNATIMVTAQHHEKNINNAKIYVKYSAQNDVNRPWDDSFTNGTAVLDSMKAGDYFFYAEGYDDAIANGTQQLTGSAFFRVIDTLAKEYKIYIQMDDWLHHRDNDQ